MSKCIYSPFSLVKTPINPDTRWPQAADMNTRLRRLFAAFMRFTDREHLDIIKAEKVCIILLNNLSIFVYTVANLNLKYNFQI